MDFWDREYGLKAAKDNKMLTLGDKHIILNVPIGLKIGERFLKGLLGPLARKYLPENLEVSVEGGYVSEPYDYRRGWHPGSTAEQVEEYLLLEGIRISKRAAKKAAENKDSESYPIWKKELKKMDNENGLKIISVKRLTPFIGLECVIYLRKELKKKIGKIPKTLRN